MNTVKRKIISAICLLSIFSNGYSRQRIDIDCLCYFEDNEYHEKNHQKVTHHLTPCLNAKFAPTPLILEQAEDISSFFIYPNPFRLEQGIKIYYQLNSPQVTSIYIRRCLFDPLRSPKGVIIKPESTENEGKYTYTFTKENFEEYGLITPIPRSRQQYFYEIILTAGDKNYIKKIMRKP